MYFMSFSLKLETLNLINSYYSFCLFNLHDTVSLIPHNLWPINYGPKRQRRQILASVVSGLLNNRVRHPNCYIEALSSRCRLIISASLLSRINFQSIYYAKIEPRDSPLRTSIFFKNGQINRVTNFSSNFGPTESDSEKKLGGYLDPRRGNWI